MGSVLKVAFSHIVRDMGHPLEKPTAIIDEEAFYLCSESSGTHSFLF